MNSKRLHLLLTGAICLLIIGLLAGAYGTNKLLSSHAAHLTSLKAKDQALGDEQTSLIIAKKDIQKYAGLQKIAQAVVPEDKDQAETVREIVDIAGANGVSLSSITFPASTLGTVAPSSATNTSTTATTPSPAAAANSKLTTLSQLVPVTNIPGVYNLTISIQSDPSQPVAYNKFINFLSALEHNRRTAQVSTISLTPSTTNPNLLSFNLMLSEYIKP